MVTRMPHPTNPPLHTPFFQERIDYTPYGVAIHPDAADINNEGC